MDIKGWSMNGSNAWDDRMHEWLKCMYGGCLLTFQGTYSAKK